MVNLLGFVIHDLYFSLVFCLHGGYVTTLTVAFSHVIKCTRLSVRMFVVSEFKGIKCPQSPLPYQIYCQDELIL